MRYIIASKNTRKKKKKQDDKPAQARLLDRLWLSCCVILARKIDFFNSISLWLTCSNLCSELD